VLSGDSHAFWVNDLHDQAGARIGAEFGATAVSSPGVCDYAPGLPVNAAFEHANPEVRFCDHGAKGFILLTLTREAATAELVTVSTVRIRRYRTRVLRRYVVRRDAPVAGFSETTESAGGGEAKSAERRSAL
jgi:alkaline phosphatase D